MKDFMTHLADKVWPQGKRYGKKQDIRFHKEINR